MAKPTISYGDIIKFDDTGNIGIIAGTTRWSANSSANTGSEDIVTVMEIGRLSCPRTTTEEGPMSEYNDYTIIGNIINPLREKLK